VVKGTEIGDVTKTQDEEGGIWTNDVTNFCDEGDINQWKFICVNAKD